MAAAECSRPLSTAKCNAQRSSCRELVVAPESADQAAADSAAARKLCAHSKETRMRMVLTALRAARSSSALRALAMHRALRGIAGESASDATSTAREVVSFNDELDSIFGALTPPSRHAPPERQLSERSAASLDLHTDLFSEQALAAQRLATPAATTTDATTKLHASHAAAAAPSAPAAGPAAVVLHVHVHIPPSAGAASTTTTTTSPTIAASAGGIEIHVHVHAATAAAFDLSRGRTASVS